MKTRIITGIVSAAAVLLVIFSNIMVFNFAYIIISLVLMFEMLHAAKNDKYLFAVNMIGALFFPLCCILFKEYIIYFMVFYLILIFIVYIFNFKNIKFEDVTFSVFTFMYIQMLLAFFPEIKRLGDNGNMYLLLMIASVVFSDTFAYFIGVTMGKHKLCPLISPKKTIEGSVGAFVGAILSTMIICAIYDNMMSFSVNYIVALIYSVFCGGLSQIGDLTASSIKRHYEVKDYGEVLPGHGGIMDRLDSMLIVAPIFYLFITKFSFIGV